MDAKRARAGRRNHRVRLSRAMGFGANMWPRLWILWRIEKKRGGARDDKAF